MATCALCHKIYPLHNHSLTIRVSAYTVLDFCCVECLIQYLNIDNCYHEDCRNLLESYLEFNRK